MDYNVWETCMLVPGFSRDECASWVQAWVSGLAIAATGYGVHRAHTLEMARQKQHGQGLRILV